MMVDREPIAVRRGNCSSASAKMTASAERFAYTSVIGRCVVASAVLMIEITGVIPLPPANATIGTSVSRNTNSPVGRITSIVSPAASESFIQFDMRPPGTRFTVVVNRSPTSGELDIE